MKLLTACNKKKYHLTPLILLSDEGSPKLLFGARTSGVSFFDVQDARMSRVHGCTGATLGTSFFGQAKEKFCTWMYLCCDRMDAKEQ